MAATTIEIKKYAYSFFSTRDDDPWVQLYNAAGAQVGVLHFQSAAGALPAAQNVGGIYHLYYRRTALPDIIDMLRNEKPVYLTYQPEGANNSQLSTLAEPVGETEPPAG